ncbi:MAG: hypothetical protein KAV00_09850 [Phycisphaerae bacterium]|nr:hypothetical protein [Phycisphaerae bacterium]
MATKSVVWPCAHIDNPEEFFAELGKAIVDSPNWTLCENNSSPPAVRAKYEGNDFNGEDLRVYVFGDGSPHGLVHFATTPKVWPGVSLCGTCVTDEQINNAFKLFQPIARKAAQSAGFKLNITFARPRTYKLSKKMEVLIDRFIHLANLGGLHPCDWERFYLIIRHAHTYRLNMTPSDLGKEIASRNVPAHMVKELCNLYDFGRSLLANNYGWLDRCRRNK